MSAFYSLLLGNTSVAIVIALLAVVAVRLNRPAAAHVLWLLVIVKLLTPPIVRVEVGTDGGGRRSRAGGDVRACSWKTRNAWRRGYP
jgi:hypothetical protein